MLVRNVRYALKRDHNVYIGRGDGIRKRSPLSNPFWIKNYNDDAERKESIEKYKVWLWAQMKSTDPKKSEPVWNELRRITPNSILLCHCYPKRCHGEIVKQAWEWAYKQGLIPSVGESNAKRLEQQAALSRKAEGVTPDRSPEMQSIIAGARAKVAMDAKLDEELLASLDDAPHARANEIERNMRLAAPPKKKQGRSAPRKPRGIIYIQPDTKYNALDDMLADLPEVYNEYRWTETVWTTPTVLAASA